MKRKEQNERLTILALETAIGGGSISIFLGGIESGHVSGKDNISRSEELLPSIKELLAKCEIKADAIDLIAVSRGPGSFTGIRIGISTAIGLARSLNIPCVGVPILQAIAASHPNDLPLTVMLPMGKHEVVHTTFSNGISVDSSAGTVGDLENVWSLIDSSIRADLLVHESLLPRIKVPVSVAFRLESLESNLARFIGLQAKSFLSAIDLTPIYLQNPAKRSKLF